MGRARRARKIAATAAYGGGGVAASVLPWGRPGGASSRPRRPWRAGSSARPSTTPPTTTASTAPGRGEPYDIVVLGDSSAAGMGTDAAHETVGAIIASGVAALTGRRVRLTNRAVVGAESSDLERQLANSLEDVMRPDVVLIMVGANDVTHRIERSASVRQLEQTVRRIRALGSEVVVGTCPDLGTIQPIRQPLRSLMKRWSRDLAAAQTVAVVEAGGRTVSLGDLIGPEFARVAARDVQQGPVPPVGGRVRPRGRCAAAERVRRPGGLGRGHLRPGARGPPWRGRRAGRGGGRARRQGAGHRGGADPDRRPVARPARALGGHPAAPARRGAACRRTPRSRPSASRRAPTTRSPRPRPDRASGGSGSLAPAVRGQLGAGPGARWATRRRSRRARPRPSSAGRSGRRRRPSCSPGGSRRRSRRAPTRPRRPARRRRR